MVSRTGWNFFWDALHNLMDRTATEEQIEAISARIRETPGVLGFHDLRIRKTGDMIQAEVHLEINGSLSVAEGHDIALLVTTTVLAKHPALHLMTHVDPTETISRSSCPPCSAHRP